MNGLIPSKRTWSYVTGALVVGGLTVAAATQSVATGASETEPPNLGNAKTQVEHYYGDKGDQHASPTSQWARDVNNQVGQARGYLESRLASGVRDPAIVLDIDDTSELTYQLEAANDFGFDQQAFDEGVRQEQFPAITQTRDLVNWAHGHGVRIFFVTGRDEPLRAPTADGLKQHGYPEPDGLFLDPTDKAPDYLPCGTDCSTVEYKSGTRAHLEQQGNTILANLGDQQSDLAGGHAERGFKLPNPMYFLP